MSYFVMLLLPDEEVSSLRLTEHSRHVTRQVTDLSDADERELLEKDFSILLTALLQIQCLVP